MSTSSKCTKKKKNRLTLTLVNFSIMFYYINVKGKERHYTTFASVIVV